ncbi:MAG: DUF4252 domain-containing protein [Rubrivivax sp.]|nr:DUF4252 domain-containing protein [Pyrinomonadaceae bacterium]
METKSVNMKSTGMKSFFKTAPRLVIALTLVAIGASAARAQTNPTVGGRLRLDSLERLAPKASETVNIEVDGFLIKFASGVLSNEDPEEKNVKEILAGLKGVYVRSYDFKTEGQFSEADIAPVREQLRAPLWKRLIDLKSRGVEIEDAEVYVATDGDRIEGMAIIVVEPKEVTVVNIVGSIDMDKIRKLEGNLGIPRIHIERKREGARRKKE